MSSIKLGLLSCVALAALPTQVALGQEDPAAPAFTAREIRVTAPSLGLDKRRGYYRGVRDSMLLLQLDTLVRVPVNDIRALELLVGVRTGSTKGMKIGMVVGLALGTAAGIAGRQSCIKDPDNEAGICAIWLLGGPAAGVAAGAVLGTVFGGSQRKEQWREVPVSALPVAIFPSNNGVGLSFSFQF